MKKLSFLLMLLVAVFFASCSSCSHKNDNVDPLDVPTEFEENLTEKDTAAVKEVIATFISHIQNGEYYDAAGMVYRQEFVGDQVTPRQLENEEMDRLVAVYKIFPILDYKIDYMRFRENDLNEVCLTVIMKKGENGQPDATSKMFFNPIYHHNVWRLVLDDSHQGTETFVPVMKRDSMRNVYKHSKASTQGNNPNAEKKAAE